MCTRLKKYVSSFNMGLRNNVEYRFNFVTVLLFNFLPVLVNLFLWRTVYLSEGVKVDKISAMTLEQVVSYIIFVQFISLLNGGSTVEYKIKQEILDGQICRFLLKPINYFRYNLSLAISQNVMYIIPLTLILLAVLILFGGYITITHNVVFISLFIIQVMLAFFISYHISFLLGLIAFFLNEISDLYNLLQTFFRFLSGAMFPLVFLPGSLKTISRALPFQYTSFSPCMTLIGKYDLNRILTDTAISFAWVVALHLAYKYVWKKGLRKYSAYGG